MPIDTDEFSKRLANQVGQEPPRNAAAGSRPPSAKAPGTPPRKRPGGDSFAGRLAERMKAANAKAAPTPAAGASQPGNDGPPQPQATPGWAGPVGRGERLIKQGDCVTSIAKDSGHLWRTIWDDPANAELRDDRRDPNVLLPQDRVHVPPVREKFEPGQTEMRHRFHRRGEAAALPLRLMLGDEPLANQRYTLEIDNQLSVNGFTDAEGKLKCAIPGNARKAHLIVGEERHEFTLDLGHMDPVDSIAGIQKRLLNLGFDCRRTDGQWDRRCQAAVRRFQRKQGLPETGEPDDATRERLREAHGS